MNHIYESTNENENEDKISTGTYNISGIYTLYTIKANPDDEIAKTKKVGDLHGMIIEEVINDFLYKEYQKDYLASYLEVNAYLKNPNYIQEKVAIYMTALLLDGFIGDLNVAMNDYIVTLKKKIEAKIIFLQKPFVPESFDDIVRKYNLPDLLEKDEFELFDTWYDGIDFIITYDPIIQT